MRLNLEKMTRQITVSRTAKTIQARKELYGSKNTRTNPDSIAKVVKIAMKGSSFWLMGDPLQSCPVSRVHSTTLFFLMLCKWMMGGRLVSGVFLTHQKK